MPPIHTGKNINELPINRSHNVGTASIMVTMQSVIKLRTQTNKSVSRIPKEQAHIISPVNSRLEILLKFSFLAKITAIRLIIFIIIVEIKIIISIVIYFNNLISHTVN